MTSQKAIAIGAVSVAVVGFLGLMVVGLLNRSSVTGLSGLSRVQKPAPEIKLPLFDGGELVLSQDREQPSVINFWASWCPPCREEALVLERTWRGYKDKGVMFLGVDIQDTEESAMAFLREYDITYPNVRDVDGKITVAYGVIGLPVTFFVNRQGIVERRWVGAIKQRQLVAWVDELIAGLEPTGDREGVNPEDYYQLEQDS